MKNRTFALLASALFGVGALRAEPSATVVATTYNTGVVVNEWAQYTLQTGGAVTVKDGANVTFSAGNQITLYPGFSVEPGGVFKAVVSASPSYNPGGYYSGSAPTLVVISGDQQYGAVGHFNLQPFDIAVFNTAGTAPLVSAPVLLTVSAGGGWLATTNDANAVLSKNLQLTTDSEGTVNAYYKHGATVGVTSYIHAVAGTQMLQLLTYSTEADTTAPSVPANLSASQVTTNGFTLNWSPSTDNVGVTGYLVYKDGEEPPVLVDGTLIEVSGLTPSTSYSMTVKARDAAGNLSAASAALMVTTLAPPDTTAPSAPTNLASSLITTTTFTLTWAASTDNVGVADYLVYKDNVQVGSPVATTSLEVGGLAASTAYSMTVKARDAAGNISFASQELTVTTQSATSAWEIAFFGAVGVSFTANPDGDALTNLQEYQQGRHPLVSDDGVALYVDAVLGNDTTYNGFSVWPGLPSASHGPKATLTAAITAATTGDIILILSNPAAYQAATLTLTGKNLVLRPVGNVSIQP